jgi:uncharacterized membrane protein YvbJ
MARYCTKCGKENLDDATFCTSCGTSMASSHERHFRHERYRNEEYFMAPRGGSIVGIVFGIFLIFVGMTLYAGWVWNWSLVGAGFLLLLGTLIIIAALYFRRRQPL